MKTQSTGYWTFFCNPAKWEIDKFLSSGKVYDTYMVTPWQEEWFNKGEFGVVRVGVDTRSAKTLQGRNRLKPGIYALVEVRGKSREIIDEDLENDTYWIGQDTNSGQERKIVDVRYVKNLLGNPILISDLKRNSIINDTYLLNGFQSSTMPLAPKDFKRIADSIDRGKNIFENIEPVEVNTVSKITELEDKYKNAMPQVKEVISSRIERGGIAQKIKKIAKYECLICKELGRNPISFLKKNREPYIEAHHVIPVAARQRGILASTNLITVCANHHCELHYGDTELIETTNEHFVFRLVKRKIRIKKISL